MPPLAVYQDGTIWRWACRVPHCWVSECRWRHRDALADGLAHLAAHRSFGFQGVR